MSKLRKAFMRNLYSTILFTILLVLGIGMFAQAYRPYSSSTLSSVAEFRQSSRFAANYVHDRPFLWLPMAPVQIITTDGLASIGGGAGTYVEVGTSEAIALFLDADNDTVGTGIVPFPVDIDLAQDIQCRTVWLQSEAAGTGTITWTMTYEVYVGGTSAVVVPNDAVDTAAGAQVDLAADVLTLGNWNTIDGGTITATPGDDFFAILVKYTEATCTDAEIFGVQCRYYRKFLGGGQG